MEKLDDGDGPYIYHWLLKILSIAGGYGDEHQDNTEGDADFILSILHIWLGGVQGCEAIDQILPETGGTRLVFGRRLVYVGRKAWKKAWEFHACLANGNALSLPFSIVCQLCLPSRWT